MNFRLSPEVKQRVSQAAELSGQDLTKFAVTALSEKADEIIERHNKTLLSKEEYVFFLSVLEDNRETAPSERSLNAAAKYKQGKRKGVRYELAD